MTSSATALEQAANAAQGVHWLLRAADQGHTDAHHLLAECFAQRRGINDRNRHEVQAFLEQSAAERAARRAARELFACLSNGEHYITAAQLERKMRRIWNVQKNSSGAQRQRRRRRRSRTNASDSDDDDDDDDGDTDTDTDTEYAADGGDDAQAGRLSRSPYRHRQRRRHNHHQQQVPY